MNKVKKDMNRSKAQWSNYTFESQLSSSNSIVTSDVSHIGKKSDS